MLADDCLTSTLTGNIETVDPCASLSGIGRLYGRYVKAIAGAPVGGTAFRGASGNLETLGLDGIWHDLWGPNRAAERDVPGAEG